MDPKRRLSSSSILSPDPTPHDGDGIIPNHSVFANLNQFDLPLPMPELPCNLLPLDVAREGFYKYKISSEDFEMSNWVNLFVENLHFDFLRLDDVDNQLTSLGQYCRGDVNNFEPGSVEEETKRRVYERVNSLNNENRDLSSKLREPDNDMSDLTHSLDAKYIEFDDLRLIRDVVELHLPSDSSSSIIKGEEGIPCREERIQKAKKRASIISDAAKMTNGDAVVGGFNLAGQISHPVKKNLRPVQMTPVFPDTRLWLNQLVQIAFDPGDTSVYIGTSQPSNDKDDSNSKHVQKSPFSASAPGPYHSLVLVHKATGKSMSLHSLYKEHRPSEGADTSGCKQSDSDFRHVRDYVVESKPAPSNLRMDKPWYLLSISPDVPNSTHTSSVGYLLPLRGRKEFCQKAKAKLGLDNSPSAKVMSLKWRSLTDAEKAENVKEMKQFTHVKQDQPDSFKGVKMDTLKSRNRLISSRDASSDSSSIENEFSSSSSEARSSSSQANKIKTRNSVSGPRRNSVERGRRTRLISPSRQTSSNSSSTGDSEDDHMFNV